MKRSVVFAVVSVALAASVLLGGCIPGAPKNGAQGGGGSTSSDFKAPPIGTPEVGPGGDAAFVPLAASSFSDGIAVFGIDLSKKSESQTAAWLTMLRPADATSWDKSTVATIPAYANGATNIGATQVVVGQMPASGNPGSPEHPFIAVENADLVAIFQFTDESERLFGGKSAEFQDVGVPETRRTQARSSSRSDRPSDRRTARSAIPRTPSLARSSRRMASSGSQPPICRSRTA